MMKYIDVTIGDKKSRIPAEVRDGALWFELQKVFVAVGYKSETTAQELALRNSDVKLVYKRKRFYGDIKVLEYARDNVHMKGRIEGRFAELVEILRSVKIEELKDPEAPEAEAPNDTEHLDDELVLAKAVDILNTLQGKSDAVGYKAIVKAISILIDITSEGNPSVGIKVLGRINLELAREFDLIFFKGTKHD